MLRGLTPRGDGRHPSGLGNRPPPARGRSGGDPTRSTAMPLGHRPAVAGRPAAIRRGGRRPARRSAAGPPSRRPAADVTGRALLTHTSGDVRPRRRRGFQRPTRSRTWVAGAAPTGSGRYGAGRRSGSLETGAERARPARDGPRPPTWRPEKRTRPAVQGPSDPDGRTGPRALDSRHAAIPGALGPEEHAHRVGAGAIPGAVAGDPSERASGEFGRHADHQSRRVLPGDVFGTCAGGIIMVARVCLTVAYLGGTPDGAVTPTRLGPPTRSLSRPRPEARAWQTSR